MRTSIAALTIFIAGSLPVAAGSMQTCVAGPTFESRIMACTTIIDAHDSTEQQRVAALGARGRHLAQIRQWEAALADLDLAISLGSRDPEIFDARGRTLAEAASLDYAARDFETAVSLAPDNARYLAHRGRTYAAMGDTSRARQDLEQAGKLGGSAIREAIEDALSALRD